MDNFFHVQIFFPTSERKSLVFINGAHSKSALPLRIGNTIQNKTVPTIVGIIFFVIRRCFVLAGEDNISENKFVSGTIIVRKEADEVGRTIILLVVCHEPD